MNIELNDEQLNALIILLELAEHEIQRVFKRLKTDDMDMKEIYYYYRYSGRVLRRKLRDLRGY